MNQNALSKQAVVFKQTQHVTYYRTTIYDDVEVSAYVAILMVNWGDQASEDLTLNLLEMGIAYSKYDPCTTVNLWDGTVTHQEAGT